MNRAEADLSAPEPDGGSPEGRRELEKAARRRLKEKNAELRERNDALRARLDELEGRRRVLAEEFAELRESFYLSGHRKKVDLNVLPRFGELARRIRSEGRIGMHLDRLYILWQAVLAAPAGPVAEVGVYRGGSAKFIAEAIREAEREPVFYACDTFAGHASTDPIDANHHVVEKFLDTSAAEVRHYLASYPRLELLEGDIAETSARLADERFGFVHIDVDVYGATSFCLRFFAPRLLPGAVIVVDDYGFVTCPGAKQAVDEFLAEHDGFRLFHLITGQALLYQPSTHQPVAAPG